MHHLVCLTASLLTTILAKSRRPPRGADAPVAIGAQFYRNNVLPIAALFAAVLWCAVPPWCLCVRSAPW